MNFCYEIFKGPHQLADGLAAVQVLRDVADRRALPWIPEFLEEKDPDIQAWGFSVLDELLLSELVDPEEAEELIKAAELHPNELVREGAASIRLFLSDRAQRDDGADPAPLTTNPD